MSNKRCPRCGRSYPSTYRSCPYCSEQNRTPGRRRRREPEGPLELLVEFLRHNGERVFLGVTAVFFIIAVFGMVLTRCSKEPDPDPKPSDQTQQPEEQDPEPIETPLVISNTTLSLAVGENAALIVTGGGEDPVVWSSSDEAVASITDGIVTANAAGSATVTASCGTRTVTCVVTVREKDPDVEVYLNRTDFTLKAGEEFQLKVRVRETKKDYEGGIVWSSDDPTIATVTEDGLVQRAGKGNTTIKATMGTKVLECIVRVS